MPSARTCQCGRRCDPAADILPTDQRDVVAEFLDEKVDQLAPMLVFLFGHVDENLGAVRVVGPQSFGEIEEDTAILLLAADRQSQELPLVEFGDRSRHSRHPD